MSLEISQSVIHKLTHDSQEIRLRALEQIETKFIRALGHQLDIEVNGVDLCRQLVRWFNFKPLQTPERVVQLLTRLLLSKHGNVAIDTIGIVRLKAELQKLKKLLSNKTEELKDLDSLLNLLSEREKLGYIQEDESDVVELIEKLDLECNEDSTEHQLYAPQDCECAWSWPTAADYNSLKFLSDVLASRCHNADEMNKALLHLHITMSDYPAEYMLQSPHIFWNLIKLFENTELDNKTLNYTIAALKTFLVILKERLLQRRKVENFVVPTRRKSGLHCPQNTLGSKSQLKVQKAMDLLLEACLQHLAMHPVSIRSDILHVMKAATMVLDIFHLQSLTVSTKLLQLAFQMREHVQNDYFQDDGRLNLARGRYLWLTFVLHEMSELNAKRSQLLGQHKFLEPTMCDFTLQKSFPNRFKEIKTLLLKTDPQLEQAFEPLELWKRSVTAATMLLKQDTADANLAPAQLISNADAVVHTLDTLKSLKLVRTIFNAILECIPLYVSKSELKAKATHLLSCLLNLEEPALKRFVHQHVSIAVKKHFAALMNGECYCSGLQNRALLSSLIIGIPMDMKLLEQLIYQCHESDDAIREYATDTLLLLLRARRFYESSWEVLLDVLVPVLPLIQGLQATSGPLREAVLTLLNPDAGQVPFIALLRGNIGLLFTSDAAVRSEALTRLIYMLNLLPESAAYIPNIMEISDILPNDLCILQSPRKFRQVFAATETYYESSTLYNLLTLLDTADIEPGVRKSTIMQLNVMLKNWELTAAFCELEAHCLVLRVLENSLQKASSIDYIESIVPAVSIVAKLLIYDSSFRQELCIIPNIYVLLLRALFYFSQDVHVRQDVSICLFLLHFGSYIVVPRGGGHLIAPAVFTNLKCPLLCELTSSTANEKPPQQLQRAVRKVFANENQWTAYMRQLIADAYFEGATFSKSGVEQLQTALDICPSFLLQTFDVRLSKATDTIQSIRALLRTISNATDGKTLVMASNCLQFHLILFVLEHRGKAQLPTAPANAIFSALSKYLQVKPGNDTDFEVYDCVLDLFHLCVRQQLQPIGQNLLNILRSDFHHGIIVMLQNFELPIDFMNKLSLFLTDLFANISANSASTESSRLRDCALRSNLFDLLQNLTQGHYTRRELQKVRCMQRVMHVLSTPALMLPHKKIFDCRKSLLRLSISIKSTTQTGAQWHRNILAIYSQLFVQLNNEQKPNVSPNTLKHLVGLAGHNDTTVRALAWLCLSQIASLEGSQRLQPTDAAISAASSGAQILTQKIMHLPGGFIGCCLSTFLDCNEIPVARHYAGSIFVTLLHETCSFDQAHALLKQHSFMSTAYKSLENCIFDQFFPLHSPYLQTTSIGDAAANDEEEQCLQFVTCDLIGCYCRICFELIQKNADYVEELCEKQLLFKLYELLKLPAAKENPSYYNMCALICQLYARCADRNLVFLQRTLCHDERWLLCFFQLLRPPSHAPDICVVYVLQLLLALLQEDFVYQKLCVYFAENLNIVQQLFQRALNLSKANRTLQCYAQSVLSLLLIKSQLQPVTDSMPAENCVPSFALVIEAKITVMSSSTAHMKTSTHEDDKENKRLNSNSMKNKTLNKERKPGHENNCKSEETTEKLEELTIAELLLTELNRIFCHFYPSNTCKFEVTPSPAKIRICETLSVLLKTSPHACKAADDVKLFDKILHILTMFVQELKTSCADFVRHNGESKKRAVVRNLQVIFELLLNWFSPTGAILTDELHCLDLSKILIQIWPWLAYDSDLRQLVIKLLAFLSERSLMLCRQFSTLISSYAHSILQLVIKLAVSETQKLKTSNASTMHVPIVSWALRVMTNCSACSEGRFTLVKEHTLDIFDGLYPLNLKSPKIRGDILQHWLQFWELFSRYNEGGLARNINALCDVVQRAAPCSVMRLLCLKILRNMCFVANNRGLFISSPNFIYIVDEIVGQPMSSHSSSTEPVSYEEQFIVCVCLWQILAGGVKYVARIRGSRLVSKMHILRDKLAITSEQIAEQTNDSTYCTDLANVLDIIFTVFKD